MTPTIPSTSPLSEFSLIDRFFAHATRQSEHVTLGIGDDCALLRPPAGEQIAISTDMLVEGRHFFPDVDPCALGHKTLAVNLSDLAAMGARPMGFTLALALPDSDPAWLAPFAQGLSALADRYGCPLIGGDTTRGPRNLCVTIFGSVPDTQALRRSAAQPGDDIWVSGTLGDARLALGALRGEWSLQADDLALARHAMDWPEPQISLGLALRGVARAALDISDGLLGDLGHILERSNVSAQVNVDALPRSALLSSQTPAVQRRCTLAGGDDYQLCFCADSAQRHRIAAIGDELGIRVTRIGTIAVPDARQTMLQLHDNTGAAVVADFKSFDHFQ
ncbi:thiamine-phosphate kinase [Pandoraea apista]|uniref:thiamine-phosphate kinase n=1 Tax=Pandoraea apista TaxID=93218 RepID=UPI00065881D0|nr:thiamine-phosphate kinase [Pandoraea apista]ALS66812.1 thiamine-phosphate kinase [Pandoraea apista]AVF38344.1 thiamine-phosphate kinase [Pandoraea apista]RRW94774.1 thiamine-phosphate kinase [Pandoraea apista]RRX03079.1 thiamine-phosphate kinase [Pandoraea apista]CFB61141.1 Thiamine-monophosphate kinase [Pandoraea apista]